MSSGIFLKRILVPTDGSSSSTMAEEIAAAIAKKSGASVVVFHVMPDILVIQQIPDRVQDDLRGSVQQRAEVILSEARAFFAEEKVKVDTETMVSTDAAASILDYAKDNFNLIIMGAQGENKETTIVLGSVTKKVLTQTPCPVLITKKVSTISHMLVCVDGSERSIRALKFAAGLAETMGSKITLLNVQETRLHKASADIAKRIGEKVLSDSLDAVKNRKIKINKKLEAGSTSNTIVSTAEKEKCDVIVLGNKGFGTVKRFLLGSVSDDVSQLAKSSVLIVP